MDSKPFWASKTLIVNIVAVIAAVASSFGLGIGAEIQAELVGITLGVANIALRFVTTKPLTT